MIPRQFRLKQTKAFDATYRNHKIVSDSVMTIYTGKIKKSTDINTRFGFVVSKKYHKRAVKRNRIRRLMRESLRLYIKDNNFSPKYMSLVFTGSTRLLGQSFKEVNTSMLKLLEMIND